MRQILGKQAQELSGDQLHSLINGREVVIDLGTGDGKFVYEYAKEHPDVFVIGIDAAAQSMADVSFKASRKPAKGGLDNVLFLWAAAEKLPSELTGIATKLYINFPWGSLLKGVATFDVQMWATFVGLLRQGGILHIYTSYDQKYEPQTITELGLPELTLGSLRINIEKIAGSVGLDDVQVEQLDDDQKAELLSSWPKRILRERDREVFLITCIKDKKEGETRKSFSLFGNHYRSNDFQGVSNRSY